MKVEIGAFTSRSILTSCFPKYDYSDSYSICFNDPDNSIGIEQVLQVFRQPSPQWIDKLFAIRNALVSLIGLKTPERENSEKDPHRIGIFRKYASGENEVVLGDDDKHLDFRLSVRLDNHPDKAGCKFLIFTTVVHYHNLIGKLYFIPVKPFHRCLVKSELRRCVHQLEL